MKPLPAEISLPLHTTVSLISKCNLDCTYCYAQPFNFEIMPLEYAKQLLWQLKSDGVFTIKVAGGEPLMYPWIFDLLDFIAEKKIPVALLSNGAVFDEKKLTRLGDALRSNRFIDFQVSIDSIRPEENDVLRGQTKRVVHTIDYLTNNGVELQLATVLTRLNVASLPELIEYFYPRIKKFHFMNLMPTPKAASRYRELALNRDELKKFWLYGLKEIQRKFGPDLKLSAEEHFKNEEVDRREASCTAPGCLAGVTFVDIDANFDVLACNCANTFKLGNLKNNSLKEIWQSALADQIRGIRKPLCHLYLERTEANKKIGLPAPALDELISHG